MVVSWLVAYVGAAVPRVLRRLAWSGRRRVVVVVELEGQHALCPQLGLRRQERLHAAERGVGLPPHQLPPHQSLQLHDAPQRAQSRPRLPVPRQTRRRLALSKKKENVFSLSPVKQARNARAGGRSSGVPDSL